MDAITSSFPTDKLDGTVEDLKNAKGHLTVRDYKTASTMPTTFSYPYKLQAMCYSYILTKMGIPITEMELCFVVKPTKTLPVRTKSFKLPYDSNSHNFIEGILMLIAESVQCFKDYEDLQYLLACDYRLKVNDIPRP
jgi:RecB family exonuclease